MNPCENIKVDGNYMSDANIFKGCNLSEVLIPTLTRTTSRRPALLNLVLSHVFTLDLGRESFPHGLQSEYPSTNNIMEPIQQIINITMKITQAIKKEKLHKEINKGTQTT